MVDQIISATVKAFNLIPFSGATWFLLAIITFFVVIFVRANKDPTSPVAWEDLIIDTVTKKASPYKLGYLIGLIVATWVVVALTDAGKLSLDMFGAYLTYLLGGAGWGFAKKGAPTPDPQSDPQQTTDVNVTVVDQSKKVFAPPPGN
jgi:hypothetical protein